MAAGAALLSLLAMGLQYRLVDLRMTEAQRTLLAADLDGLAALYEQRRIIALREAINYRSATSGGGGDVSAARPARRGAGGHAAQLARGSGCAGPGIHRRPRPRDSGQWPAAG
jgi:hypothetical protein